jgi:hypothetical protein
MRFAYALRILIEQMTVVGFFTLKGLNPRDVHAEFVLIYDTDVFVLQALYKWHKRFAQGRTERFDDPRSGRP